MTISTVVYISPVMDWQSTIIKSQRSPPNVPPMTLIKQSLPSEGAGGIVATGMLGSMHWGTKRGASVHAVRSVLGTKAADALFSRVLGRGAGGGGVETLALLLTLLLDLPIVNRAVSCMKMVVITGYLQCKWEGPEVWALSQ